MQEGKESSEEDQNRNKSQGNLTGSRFKWGNPTEQHEF